MWKKQGWILENSKKQTIWGSGKWDEKKKKGKQSSKEEINVYLQLILT